jgi:hypothetical protein
MLAVCRLLLGLMLPVERILRVTMRISTSAAFTTSASMPMWRCSTAASISTIPMTGRTNCTAARAPAYDCTSAHPSDRDDSHGHGTNSALDIAALDNGIGKVGAAAGAACGRSMSTTTSTLGGSSGTA